MGDTSDIVSALRRHPVFNSCSDEVLSGLAATGTRHVGLRGTRVASADCRFPYLALVSAGVLSVAVSGDGPTRGVRRLQLFEARAGDVIGELAFLENAAPLGDVVILSKRASYVLFPSNTVEKALEADPALMRRLAVRAAKRARAISRRLIEAQGFTATSRIASVLLRFVSDGAGLQPAQPELAEITQRELAAAASCVKETAARAIGLLESAGALQRVHGHIRFLDRDLLTAFAADEVKTVARLRVATTS